MLKRSSGILLHISSLPSPFGIGDFGSCAYHFIDFLVKAGQRYWQILPITSTEYQSGNSPYSCPSSYAGNILLISPEILLKEKLLRREDCKRKPRFAASQVNYRSVISYKRRLLEKAYGRFQSGDVNMKTYEDFCRNNQDWLDDYALFEVIKGIYPHRSWCHWPRGLRDRRSENLREFQQRHHLKITKIKFYQYLFFSQWHALRSYANQKGIKIVGDIPIYVDYNSSDVWTNPQIFKLDRHQKARYVAGVPPDYFSETGQRWGNPVYDWKRLKKTRYAWWCRRIQHNLNLFDVLRIDHFRGFAAYWEVPSKEKTAIDGKWVPVPGKDFFQTLKRKFKPLPILAEDIGYITQDVRDLMHYFRFPGMKVLLFGFGGNIKKNDHYPLNHTKHFVVYTGTHDNNTVKGWWQKEATQKEKENVFKFLKRKVSPEMIHWEFIKIVSHSPCVLCLVPLQDLLGIDHRGRMNVPATAWGNWQWRCQKKDLRTQVVQKLKRLTQESGRSKRGLFV